MKLTLFLFLAITIASKSNSQVITNKINEVKRGSFKGKNTINKVDSMFIFIGKVIINQKSNDSILFAGSICSFDTASKYYVTQYSFIPAKQAISFDVDVIINFDKPFSPWYTTIRPPENAVVLGWESDIFRVNAINGECHTSNTNTDDFKSIRVRGSVIGEKLDIVLKSKERIYATINSIYGAIGVIKKDKD